MKRSLWGASMLAIAAAMPMAAMAQEQQPTQSGQSGYVSLDPITIFATLSPLAAFDYPGQVSVVDREELDIQQPSSLGDALKYIPGVYVDGGPRRSGQTPSIRGFENDNILILVDGVRQDFISGHQGRIFVEPDLLKRIEVVKGPISSLYGSGALGGVIALTTVDASDFLDPGETAGARIKAGWQSADDQFQLSTTAFARSEDQRFDVLASFTYRDIGDIELGSGTTLPNSDDIKSGLVKANAQLTPDLKLTTSWVHYLDDAVTPSNPQGNFLPGQDDEGLLLQNVKRKILSDTVSGKLSYAPSDNPLIDGNLLAYWSRNKVEEDAIDADRFLSRDVQTVGVNIDNRSRIDLSSLNGRVTFTYGGEYHVDRQSGKDTCPIGDLGCAFDANGNPFPPSTTVPGAPSAPSGKATYGGAFVQAEFKFDRPMSLPGEFTLLPGVRWDTFSNEASGQEDFSDEAISPKLAASYKPIPWFLLFANYGKAFRAPTYNELYPAGNHFPLDFGPFGVNYNSFLTNPDLKPQVGETIEGGAGFDFSDVVQQGDRLKIKGSYWHTDAKDFINLDVIGFGVHGTDFGCLPLAIGGTGDGCFSQYINTPNAELEGVEIEARYDSARFYGGIAYSSITGKDTDTGDYLASLQPDRVILDAGIKVPEWWARFGSRFTFAGKFDKVNVPTEVRGSYNLVDLYASFEPTEGPLKGFRLDLGVDNLTDEAYEVIEANSFEKGVNYKAAITWTKKW